MTERLLDLRGMRCPWPALRVARAMREQGSGGGALIVLADDPAAPREIAALARERGGRFEQLDHALGPAFRIRS